MYAFYEDFNIALENTKNYRTLGFKEYKYSYLIVKPNGAKHFKTYVDELIQQQFTIIGFFAIQDYETLNISLHPTEREQHHIVPINNMFKDFYSNYAILILRAKNNITYPAFVRQVYLFKTSVRKRFEVQYVSYVFDTSELLGDNQHQLLKIYGKNNQEVSKREMNHEGTFLVFSVNSLHSPDPDLKVTVSEIELLKANGIFLLKNLIPNFLVESIKKYETFAFLKDM